MGRMVSVVALGASLALEGWYHYLDRDLRKRLGMKIKAPLRAPSSRPSRARLTRTQWRADATAERISFVPGLLPYTPRYTTVRAGSSR